MSVWSKEAPQQIRSFMVHKNLEEGEYEFHLRGVKVAAVSIFKAKDPKVIHAIVDQLHNIHHHALKFLNEHPEASLAPAHEGTPESEVASYEELRG